MQRSTVRLILTAVALTAGLIGCGEAPPAASPAGVRTPAASVAPAAPTATAEPKPAAAPELVRRAAATMRQAETVRGVGVVTITLFGREIEPEGPNVLIVKAKNGHASALGQEQSATVDGTTYTRAEDRTWRAEPAPPPAAGAGTGTGFLDELTAPSGQRLEPCAQNLLCQVVEATAPGEKPGDARSYAVWIGLFDARVYRYEAFLQAEGPLGPSGSRVVVEFSGYNTPATLTAPQGTDSLLLPLQGQPKPKFLLKGPAASAATPATGTTEGKAPVIEQTQFLTRNGYTTVAALARNPNADLWLPVSDYTITVYDAAGKVVGTDQNVTALGPGEARWLIAGQIATGTDAVARADLQLRPTKAWRPAASWPAPELTVSQATYRDDRFSPRVVGEITHGGATTPLSQVQITTVHWDAQGQLVATGLGFVSSVAPGQTVSFEAAPVVRGEGPVARTETQATAVLLPGLY